MRIRLPFEQFKIPNDVCQLKGSKKFSVGITFK